MKKFAAFPGGALTDFWFPKRGGGGGPRARHLRALLCAQGQEAAIVFLHLNSFAIRWTVPVPMPSDLATFRIPVPFASCFRTLRSVVLSIFGRPIFTPWATARLRLANHGPLKFSKRASELENELAHRGRRIDGLRAAPAACRARGMKASRGCTSERRD
jgi:hypothetical protein